MENKENPLTIEMPYEATYELNIFGTDGQCVHEIQMSREEFLALREHLARIRGFQVPEENG